MLPPRFVTFAFDLHYRGLDPLQQSGFLPELRFAPSAYVSRLPVVAGSVSPMSARYLLVTCALAVRRCCCSRLMLVINLSSPTAVAGRIRVDKQLTNTMFTRLQPVDRLPDFQPLFTACFWRRDIVYHETLFLSRKKFEKITNFWKVTNSKLAQTAH